MRKIIMSIVGMVVGGILSLCQMLGIIVDDETVANNYFENVIEALESSNKDILREQFAKTIVDDEKTFDEKMEEAFEYFSGDVDSYDFMLYPSGGGGAEDGMVFKDREAHYIVKTTEGCYRCAIFYIPRDDRNADNEGIHSLYIIKEMDDKKNQYEYFWGEEGFADGINVGIGHLDW